MKWWRSLYFQVLVAIVAGAALGYFKPSIGAELKPLGEAFVNAVKMLIGPIIFCTVVGGLSGVSDLRKLGRVGLKTLLYFEVLTTLALIIGMVVANVFQPGADVHADPAKLNTASVAKYISEAKPQTTAAMVSDILLKIIPKSFVGAFAGDDILQVLFASVLFGIALAQLGERGRAVAAFIHDVSKVFFGIMGIISRAAPVAAFGAMAFTVSAFGADTLKSLGLLMACVYLTCILFVVIVLGAIARLHGFSMWRVLKLIKEELFIVLGTSSSESALPLLMDKLERNGCGRSVVDLVVPAGYSFNLDGTCIYLTMAVLFLAQATGTVLTLGEQLGILGVLLLTSKGAAGVTGAGFITLAATLATTGKVPVASIVIIFGVDRFMSEARAITNLIGNTVATLVISKWEGEFDAEKGKDFLAGRRSAEL